MNRHTRRTTAIAVIVALVAGGGAWLAQRDGESPPAATGLTTAPTPPLVPPHPSPRQ